MEVQNNLERQFEDFIKPKTELPPLVSLEDIGKEAIIKEVGFVVTKWGMRLRVSLEFEGGQVKNILLTRTLARALHQAFKDKGLTSIKEWAGMRVKVEKIALQVRGRVIERPIIKPL